MDPITLIVTALATGAAQGVTDNASAMVKDAYSNLGARVKKVLGGGRVLSDPETRDALRALIPKSLVAAVS
jgi:hypothetical protein